MPGRAAQKMRLGGQGQILKQGKRHDDWHNVVSMFGGLSIYLCVKLNIGGATVLAGQWRFRFVCEV